MIISKFLCYGVFSLSKLFSLPVSSEQLSFVTVKLVRLFGQERDMLSMPQQIQTNDIQSFQSPSAGHSILYNPENETNSLAAVRYGERITGQKD